MKSITAWAREQTAMLKSHSADGRIDPPKQRAYNLYDALLDAQTAKEVEDFDQVDLEVSELGRKFQNNDRRDGNRRFWVEHHDGSKNYVVSEFNRQTMTYQEMMSAVFEKAKLGGYDWASVHRDITHIAAQYPEMHLDVEYEVYKMKRAVGLVA